MIAGLRVKPLRVIPDERSRLMEILRADDEMFEKFGQLYMTTAYPGVGTLTCLAVGPEMAGNADTCRYDLPWCLTFACHGFRACVFAVNIQDTRCLDETNACLFISVCIEFGLRTGPDGAGAGAGAPVVRRRASSPRSKRASPSRPGARSMVPRLVKFSGVLKDSLGQPLAGMVGVTFALYEEQEGGAPLLLETQNLQLDEQGRYTVLLGATQSEGLPLQVFTTGEARWLGIQVQGQPEQPRLLLVSVPYALKAEEAQKLAGRSASDFVLAERLETELRQQAETIVRQEVETQTMTTAEIGEKAITESASTFIDNNATQVVLVDQLGTGGGLLARTPSSRPAVWGQSESSSGRGVLGWATDTSGTTYGVWSEVASANGTAGAFNNTAGGKILSGLASGSEVFSVDGSGNVTATAFVGDGSGLTNFPGGGDADTLDGLDSTDFAQLAAANSFTADQSITGDLTPSGSINNGFRVEANATSPNLVGGFSGNSVTSGVVGTTIAGGGASGSLNRVTDNFGTVGGGYNNQAGDNAGAVSDMNYATVGGGANNTASASYASVGGGRTNTASGGYASVPGGDSNTAQADYSFAAGRRAKANHAGAFVWGDSTNADVASTGINQFIVRAAGGVWFYSSSNLSTGVNLAAGSGSWSSLSDRHSKENFAPVDGQALLARLNAIPIQTWNYRAQHTSIRPLGPMAQDFHAAFGLGEDDKHITMVDADGVALAATQALYRMSLEKEAQIRELRREVKQLRALVAQLAAER